MKLKPKLLDNKNGKHKKIFLIIVAVLLISLSCAVCFLPQKTGKTNKHTHPTQPLSHDFKLQILKVENTGTLSRRIYARLTNTGGDKKNVRIIFELFLKGERINVNGKKCLFLKLGDVKRNESIEKTIDISVSFFDGLRIKSAGSVNAKLVILWNGGRQVFFKKVNV